MPPTSIQKFMAHLDSALYPRNARTSFFLRPFYHGRFFLYKFTHKH